MARDANLCAVRDGLLGENTAAAHRKVYPMAAVCDICGKKPSFGMSVSHSHRRTKRRWDPNIQRVRALVNGAPEAVARLHLVHPGRQGDQAGSPDPRRHAQLNTRLRPAERSGLNRISLSRR